MGASDSAVPTARVEGASSGNSESVLSSEARLPACGCAEEGSSTSMPIVPTWLGTWGLDGSYVLDPSP